MTDPNLPGIADIAEMIALLKEGGWRHATLKLGDFELTVSDGSGEAAPAPAPVIVAPPAGAPTVPATPVPAAAPAAPAAVVDSENLVVVRAETLGAFWRSPQPGAPAFVEVGDRVEADTPLAIVEVMKLMTRITAGVAGTVTAIHVDNGDLVEAGQALVTIATD